MSLPRPDFDDTADDAWRAYAACRGMNPDLFFPERGFGSAADAKAICAGCTVRTECLDYADGVGAGQQQRFGVFGGLTEEERRARRRRRAKDAASNVVPLFEEELL